MMHLLFNCLKQRKMKSYNVFISRLKNTIPEIKNLSDIKIEYISRNIDVSIGESSNDYIWGEESDFNNNRSERQKLARYDKYKEQFVNLLLETDFDTVLDDSEIIEYTNRQIKTNHYIFLTWLNYLFLEYQRSEKVVLKLLDLLMCFSFDEIQPMGADIAIACIHLKSIAVQSKNLSLLGHWCNKQALTILESYEEPQNLWMKTKYNRLKEIIAERCSISEK